jgi:predicted transcriptional regulator
MTETAYNQAEGEMTHTGPSAGSDSQAVDSDDLLSVLSDDNARTILQLISDESLAAREIADRLNLSRATVYRRLNRLEEIGAAATTLAYDSDGHHRKQYQATLDQVVVSITADGIAINQAM